ncbi:MAG TPA: hypothetical protein VGF53_10280 [Pseudolabrys sp.]|jgi:hypothetical protein
MLKGFRLVAVLSVLLLATQAQAAWRTLAPPDAGFSVLYPDTPTAKTESKPRVVTRIWIARTSTLLCLSGVTDYDGHIDAATELQLDMKNFLAAVNGTVKSQEQMNFSNASSGPFPALDFSFNTATGAGRSLVVVAGDRTYQLVVIGVDGHDAKAETARIFSSFKISAPPRHWQGP